MKTEAYIFQVSVTNEKKFASDTPYYVSAYR